MKREFSAGGIVIRLAPTKSGLAKDRFSKNNVEVLLIHNAAMRDPKKSYFGFPKGHIHSGESSEEAALREVEEEVGIKAEVIEKVGESKYVFTGKEGKVFKVVTVYLMKCQEDKITLQENELLGAEWLSSKEALEKLSFSTDKGLLKKALEMYG